MSDATETDETTTPRCRTCGRVEVAEHTYDCPACLHAVRTDLAEIARMYAHLPAEVEHRGVDSGAMVLLGPSSDPEARGHLEASVAAGRVSPDLLEDGSGSHPLLVTETWGMVVRDALGHEEPDCRAEVGSAVAYLDGQLTTLSHDAWFPMPEMVAEVRKCRAHMESVLHDGEQIERGAPCLTCGRNLTLRYGARVADDRWECTTRWCEVTDYTVSQYRAWVEDDARRNATALTADEMVLRFPIDADGKPLKPQRIRVWGSRGQVDKRGTNDKGRTLYDVAQVEALTTRLAETA